MKFNQKSEIIKISSVTGYGLENLRDAFEKINLNN